MEQTNRTILFEEINPEKENLYTLVGDVRNKCSLTDDEIVSINQKLLVTSFEEFLKKFEPKIYGMVDMQQMKFAFAKEDMWRDTNTFCINIEKGNPFFSAIFQMLDTNNYVKKINVSITNQLISVLMDEKVQKLKRLIKEVKEEFLFGERDKVAFLLNQIADNYDMGFLFLQVLMEQLPKQIENMSDKVLNPLVVKSFNGNRIEVLRMSTNFKDFEFVIDASRREEYAEIIEHFFEIRRAQGREVHNIEALQLCLMQGAYGEENIGYLISRYNFYQDFYSKVIQVFWSEIRQLLQNVLGIYTFFQQYTVEEVQRKMCPSILVANCSVEAIQLVGNRERLIVYLDTVNSKNYSSDTIWYAILPGIAYKKDDIQDNVRVRFKSAGSEKREFIYKEISHDEEDIRVLVDILADYQVINFLSILGKRSTTFGQLLRDGIDNYNDTFNAFTSIEGKEYIVPCIPNFTIIPREFMELHLGKTYQYDDFSNEGVMVIGSKKLWLEGLYVEASYVAAGLAAAWQCPNYLNKYHKNKVTMELPGVSYRIMDGNNRYMTKTTMLREILYCSDELRDSIEKRSMGVVFLPEGNGVIMATDRCMTFQNESNDCISTVQTLVYIERVIRYETNDFKNTLIRSFFQNRPDSIKSKWFERKKNINAMIKENEDLTFQLNEIENICTFEVKFREIEKKRKVITSN